MQLSEFPENRIDLWVIKTESTRLPFEKLSSFLDKSEIARLKRYSNQNIARNFVYSRGCLRLLLASYCGICPAAVRIENLRYGKPSISDYPQLFFNVSHSGEMVLIGFSDRIMGVDIEKIREKVDYRGIIKRFFSEKEAASWNLFAQNSPVEVFFRGWTRKEAWLKATGEGIAGLGKCEVSFTPDNLSALCTMNGKASNAAKWFSALIKPAPGYIGSVVAMKPEVKLNIIDFSDHYAHLLEKIEKET